MDLGMRNILGYDYLPYMTVASLEMSDEPNKSIKSCPNKKNYYIFKRIRKNNMDLQYLIKVCIHMHNSSMNLGYLKHCQINEY